MREIKAAFLKWVMLAVVSGCLLTPGTARAANDITGNWSDVLFTNYGTYGFLFEILKTGGTYQCAEDTIELGLHSIYANSVTYAGGKCSIYWNAWGWSFTNGIISADNSSTTGVLTVGSTVYNPITVYRQPSYADFLAANYTDANGTLPYRLFVPKNYSSGNKYPLVLFLHGVGSVGTDNQVQLTDDIGVLNFISTSNQVKYPCFLVAPQCPTTNGWIVPAQRAQLLGLLAQAESEYSIDTNRIYVTGLSMGGIGTWDQLTQNPFLYAAGVPMSGAGDTNLAASIAAVPVWNFHAVNDSVVPVLYSEVMIGWIRSAGGNPIYTEYSFGDHTIWTTAYYTPGLVDWVMAQRRGHATNLPPFMTINAPTTNSTFTTGGTKIALAGTAGDTNAAVSQVNWYNWYNGSNGVCAGSNTWSVASLPLQAGSTNQLTIMAIGTSWVLALGGVTTFNASLKVNQVESPIVLAIARHGTNAAISWSGGVPPYLVQKSTNLAAAAWSALETTNATSASFPLAAGKTFFRIAGQ